MQRWVRLCLLWVLVQVDLQRVWHDLPLWVIKRQVWWFRLWLLLRVLWVPLPFLLTRADRP